MELSAGFFVERGGRTSSNFELVNLSLTFGDGHFWPLYYYGPKFLTSKVNEDFAVF